MCRGLALLPGTCLERAKGLKANLSNFLMRSHWALSSKSINKDQQKITKGESLLCKESFDRLLANKEGLLAFRAFLLSEYSEENIDFYLACEDYRKIKSPTKLLTKAKKIYEEFIQSDAPREVNIDQKTRYITKKNIEAHSRECFDLAQLKVYTLMEKDSYPRFLRSSDHQARSRKFTRKNARTLTQGKEWLS